MISKRAMVIGALLLTTMSAWAQTGRTVRNVEIEGERVISEAAITSAMRVRPGAAVTRADLDRDETNLLNLGFFRKVTILTREVGDTQVDILVQINENPVVKEIRVEGNSVISSEKITEIVEKYQKIGEIWNNRNGQPIVRDVQELYQKDGYFVDFEELGPLEESPETLNIKLLEATLGKITFNGLRNTRPRTVDRIMKSKPGEAFNLNKFRKDIENLYYTYWFEEVVPERKQGDRPNVFDFDINVKEAKTGNINAGVALDPNSRLVGTVSYSESNFRGSGQGVGLQLSQATVGGGPSAEFSFNNRFYDAKDTTLSFRLFSKVVYNFTGSGLFNSGNVESEDRFDERQTGFSIQFVRPVTERHSARVGLVARNARTIDLQTTNQPNIDFIQQDGDLITLILGGEYNSSTPIVEPVRGEVLSVTLEPGYSNITKIGGNVGQFQNLLGSSTFVRSTFEYRRYWSREPARKADATDVGLEEPRPVVAFRARYGYISGTVPFFEQLFVGGSDTHRGYANQRFWGSNSFLANLEYRYPIQRSFNLIGFVDYGGAWGGYGEFNRFTQSDDIDLRLGYGLGVAFRTPFFGSIRIDFGFNQEGGQRTHFSIGTSF